MNYNSKTCINTYAISVSLGQLIKTPESPPRNLADNVSGIGNFSLMTPSAINASSPNTASQLPTLSNMIARIPPQQQVLPSVIGKSNPTSN